MNPSKYYGNMIKITLTENSWHTVGLHVEPVDGIAIEWLEQKLQSENITVNVKVVIMSIIDKWKAENNLFDKEENKNE